MAKQERSELCVVIIIIMKHQSRPMCGALQHFYSPAGVARYYRTVFASSSNLVAFDERNRRIPLFNRLEWLRCSDDGVGDLCYTKLMTQTDPWPAAERETRPTGRIIQLGPSSPRVKSLGILAQNFLVVDALGRSLSVYCLLPFVSNRLEI